MITRYPKIKRLLQKIADCTDLKETKQLTKDVVQMLGTIIINLEADILLRHDG